MTDAAGVHADAGSGRHGQQPTAVLPKAVSFAWKSASSTSPRALDIDPRQVLELAAGLGIRLKNSALASLSPKERDRIVQRWEQRRNWGRGGLEA